MAEFFDITLPGDGEEVTNELIDLLKEYIYAVAKYMAGAINGKTKYYKYSKKVTLL